MVSEQIGKTVFGMAIVTVAAVGITYVAVNNVTGVGVLDDALIVPLVSMLKQGTILIYQTG